MDESLKFGPGLRLPVLAPLENADMVGLDLTLSIHNYVLKYLEDSHEPSPLLKEKVAKGELGFKTGGVGYPDLDAGGAEGASQPTAQLPDQGRAGDEGSGSQVGNNGRTGRVAAPVSR